MQRHVLIVIESPEDTYKCVEYFANTSSKRDDIVTLLQLGNLSAGTSGGLVRQASLKAASAVGSAISATISAAKLDAGLESLLRHKSGNGSSATATADASAGTGDGGDANAGTSTTTEEACKGSCANHNVDHVKKHHWPLPENVHVFEDMQKLLFLNGSCVPQQNVNWFVLDGEKSTQHVMKSTLIEYIESNKVDLVVVKQTGKDKGAAHELLVHAEVPVLIVPSHLDPKIVLAYAERKLNALPKSHNSKTADDPDKKSPAPKLEKAAASNESTKVEQKPAEAATDSEVQTASISVAAKVPEPTEQTLPEEVLANSPPGEHTFAMPEPGETLQAAPAVILAPATAPTAVPEPTEPTLPEAVLANSPPGEHTFAMPEPGETLQAAPAVILAPASSSSTIPVEARDAPAFSALNQDIQV